MSSAEPNAEDFKPYLVLVAKDSQNKEHETGNKGVSEKQLLELKAGTYQLWLRIDYQKLCPSDGQILRESKELIINENDENLSRNLLGRKFDTETESIMDMIFKPEGDSREPTIQGKLKVTATAEDVFPLGSRRFEPGNYELKLIGPINFRYLDYEGNLRILEEEQLDLSFWFKIDDKQKQVSSSEEDSDTSSHKGYWTEAEVR